MCDHLCLLHCSMQTQSPIVNLFIILFQYSYPKCGCTWGQCMESAHGEHFTPHAMQWNLSTKDTLGTGSSFLLSVNLQHT